MIFNRQVHVQRYHTLMCHDPGGGALVVFKKQCAMKYRVFGIHLRSNLEESYVKYKGRVDVGNLL
jgi:hypothetical protein